jgi:microcin C transport system substrate-binding protein
MEADLQKTLKEQASFYRFKKASDLDRDTQGLAWEDGLENPEFADPGARRGGTLNLWIPDFPGTFRTMGPNANGGIRTYIYDYVAPTFVVPHPNYPGKYCPGLARAWAVDRAHRTVYFRLFPDARWSDGVPFTTDDVVFTWYLQRSPNLDDPWYNDFYTKTYSALTVYDAHTFSVTVSELRPDLVERAGNVIAFPRHFYSDFGPGWATRYDWRVSPTLGAYTIRDEDIKRTTSITLTHVKDWWAEDKPFWRGRFNPDRLHLEVIREPDKALEAFLRGDVDLYPISTTNWFTKVKDDSPTVASGFTVKSIFYNQIPPPDFGLWINEAAPRLDDRNLRIGIHYATNMDLVCKQYFRGFARVQKTASDGYGWDMNPAVRPRAFDPQKAREYFARAGYTGQGPDGVLVNARGERLSFTITTSYRTYQDILVILKQEALKAGLEFKIEVLDETTGFEKIEGKKHEIALAAYSRTVEMYPRYWDFFASENAYDQAFLPDGSPNPARKAKPNTNNLSSVADPELDRLIAAYDKTETMDQVKELAAKIEQKIYDDASWVNGWSVPFYRVGYRPWIRWPKDFDAMQSLDYENFWLMWIDPDAQRETLAAKAEGRNLPVQILVHDKFKEP